MKAELSRDARALIREALAAEGVPGEEHRARLRRSLLARAAAGGVVTLVGSSVAKASASSLLATVASSVAIGFGTGIVLFGAAPLVFGPSASVSKVRAPSALSAHVRAASPGARDRREPGQSEADQSETSQSQTGRSQTDRSAFVPAEPAASNSLAQESKLRAAPRSEPKPQAESELVPLPSASASAGSPLRAELELMGQVQEALRDGQGARALSLIARYDARHPSGLLQTERLAAEVFAACQLGEKARAERAARAFLMRDRSSALAARVQKACASTISSGQ